MADDLRIGVAIFGLGRAGTIHFLNLVRNHRVSILYIVETDLPKAIDAVAKYRLTETKAIHFDDVKQVYQDTRVGAVIVCTPTLEHEQTVRAALEHGKAVFCEKPISQAEDGIRSCYEQAEKYGKPLFCSFNRRFDPSLASLRKRVLAGEIGTVQIVKTCSRGNPLPSIAFLAISGGMFHDCAVHNIDTVCWILGEFPVSVYTVAHAHIEAIAQLNDVDTVVISMKFRSGALAVIDLSRFAAYGYDQRVEVFGADGMLVSENQRPNELTSFTGKGTSLDVIKHSFPQRYADSYVQAMEHFLDVIEGKEVLSVSKTDALNVCIIATACEESFRTGKPIQLDLNTDL